ncbi:pyocin knob domain-containing protein [Limosilactobacillus reuteri]|uniref:pyocin knob domain-containing protein n=1 Tax=Limosilactobacillus reuteri TaxID=1598 RepID=UPI003D00766C
MTENNQLSDETKNNSTDTSSTDASSAVIGNHENAVVPHKISNHDKLVQTMVMVDGEWINVNDTNDQANVKYDMHKVNKKVVEAQKGIVEAKNTADSAVKYADSAISASKVNSDAIVAQSEAISEAKAAADDAASKAQFIKENASSEAAAIRNQVADVANNVSSVKADVASATSDVAELKVDVQANSAAIIKTNEAVSVQSKSSSDAINELKIANGQVESIAKDAKNNATVAKQTADAATIVAQDAKSNAVVAKQTASSATIEATNATSTASKAELSVNGLTTRVDGIEGDTKKLSGRVTSTETILQQTKDQLLQKADKSVVDQANNLISQLSAEQKTMAGQISQKVSSSDYQKDRNDTITSIEKNTTAIDENSKAIKLKADATEVNNLKGTVNSHSASINLFSDQLKSMVTESKVNDIINGKGFATQSTVQSLIDQKAGTINESITNLTNKVNSNNGGGVNLLQGTAKIEFPLNNNGGTQTIQKYDDETNYIQYTSNTPIYDMGPWWPWTPEIGQVYTMSADVCGNGYIQGGEFHYEGGDEGNLGRVDLTNDWQRISNTFRVNTISGNWVIYANNSTLLKVKHIKIERGSVATPWTPAPSDNASVSQLQSVTASIDGLQSAVKNKVDQSQYTQLAGVVQTKVSQSDFNRLNNQVNVQTLDNANIDNMKTTGHYFVHNLTGNPLGGWVYVDVTGNGNDRIRQDVYQDIGTKHAFRRWFNTFWTGWSTGAEESEITQLRSDINLRVKSGDLLSQINIAAGHTLIQSNKIYFDADSFVMSPNSTAFIPSAYITDINADKINTGTLHSITINNGNGTFRVDPDGNVYANSMHVNNGSIYQGTVLGADVYSISNLTSNSLDEVNDATQDWVKLKDGIIELHGANGDHYSSILPIDVITTYGGDGGSTGVHHGLGILDSREVIIGSASLDSEYSNRITHSRNFDLISRTHLEITNSYIKARLDPDVEYGKGALFAIQKDNKVGFYVGHGENGNQVNVQFAGDGSGFNVYGNFNVYGAKNSAVKTSQGDVAVSAYETAEYYFGDIGEGQTDSNGVAYIGIEKLFNETVNTNIPYQVFITAYGSGNIWVDQREHYRFVVKSDRPNVKFGWEIKAKRRGYENTRLQKVN